MVRHSAAGNRVARHAPKFDRPDSKNTGIACDDQPLVCEVRAARRMRKSPAPGTARTASPVQRRRRGGRRRSMSWFGDFATAGEAAHAGAASLSAAGVRTATPSASTAAGLEPIRLDRPVQHGRDDRHHLGGAVQPAAEQRPRRPVPAPRGARHAKARSWSAPAAPTPRSRPASLRADVISPATSSTRISNSNRSPNDPSFSQQWSLANTRAERRHSRRRHQRRGRLEHFHRQPQRGGGGHRHRRRLQQPRPGRQHLDQSAGHRRQRLRRRRLRRRHPRLQFRRQQRQRHGRQRPRHPRRRHHRRRGQQRHGSDRNQLVGLDHGP